MNWPRGKHNGKRIVGIELKVRIDITHWSAWWMWRSWVKGFGLGPLLVWFDANYE